MTKQNFLTKLLLLCLCVVGSVNAWATETTVVFTSDNKNDAGIAFAAMSNGNTQLVGSGIAKLIATNSVSLSTTANKYGYRCDGSRLFIVFKFDGETDLTIKHNSNSTGERYMRLYSFSSSKTLSEITSSDWATKTQQAFTSTSTTATWGGGQSSVVSPNAGKTTWNYTTKGCLTVSWENLPAGYYVMDGTGSEAYLYSFTADVTAAGAVDPTFTITPSTITVGGTATISAPDGLDYTATPIDGTGSVSVSDGVVTGLTAGSAQVRIQSDAVADTWNAYDHTFDLTIKGISSKVLTGININGSAWDIAGLSDNAATISTAYVGAPTVEFVYTINYTDESTDSNQKETVVASKSGDDYVAASTVLTNNATLTFTEVGNLIYSMTDPTAPTGTLDGKSGSDLTATYNTGSSGYVYNGHKDARAVVDGNGVNLNGSNGSYFKATFTEALKEGDVITSSNTTNIFCVSYRDKSENTTTFPYVIPTGSGLIGQTSVYVKKSGSASTFTSFTINRYDRHHVTYDLGTGTGTAPTLMDWPEGIGFTVASSDGITAPTGKVFKCWNDGTTDYSPGDTYTMSTSNVTLTAQYETAYDVTYNNGGHGVAPDAEYAGSVVLSSIKTDWYENTGWKADQDVEVDDATVTAGTLISTGKTAVLSANTTFTAQWEYTGKPYVENIAFASLADNTLDLQTQAHFTPSDGYVVLNPNDVRGNATTGYWLTSRNANPNGFTWTAPESSVFTSAESSTTILCLQLQKTYAAKFTGTTQFQALMNSRKSGSTVKALLVDYSGATPSRVGDPAEIGNTSGDTPALTNSAIATFSNLNASHTYAVFFYGYDTDTNGVLYQVAFKAPATDAITLNAKGFATYSNCFAYTVSGATAYKMALDIDGGTMTGTTIVGTIPAGEGILLKGEAGAEVTITPAASVDALTGNSLHGTTQATGVIATPAESPKVTYVLSGNKFLPYTADTFAAKKAYFQVNGSDVEGRSFTMNFDDDITTGIDDVRGKMEDVRGDIYNLNGQKVAQPAKGLYIVNGRKVVIK